MPVLRDSKSHIKTDPLRNFKFLVRVHYRGLVHGVKHANMGFMSASGLAANTEPIPYREGGDNTTTRKMPGQTDFSPITLSKGVALLHTANWYWFKKIFFVNQGSGITPPGSQFRANVDIHVLEHPVNHAGNVPTKMKFRFYNCWPSSLVYSDLDAGGNAILIEQMTLQHEGFDNWWAGFGAGTVENRP